MSGMRTIAAGCLILALALAFAAPCACHAAPAARHGCHESESTERSMSAVRCCCPAAPAFMVSATAISATTSERQSPTAMPATIAPAALDAGVVLGALTRIVSTSGPPSPHRSPLALRI